MNNNTLLYLIIATVSALLAPIFIKKYTVNKNAKFSFIWIIVSIVSYLILLLTYIKLFDGRDLGIYYILLQILQIIIIIPIGIILFGESINSMQIIGVILAIISIFLLSFYK